ncbi:MAG: hypothetical protein KDK04_06665 [Candidatus Competibacteraceae bacterium]|nr:hypothetical protein [Candidatus Competibacteraceae bacterium]MCB1811390.1 hypothetical protein [Candidatus Competibacteraceae bacterium]
MNYKPFHLCVALKTPLITNGRLTLDAILSAARFRATADPERACSDLPLRNTNGVWHGSAALFEQPVRYTGIPFVQRLHGEQDWSLELFSVSRRVRGDVKINRSGGPYVARLDCHKACAVRHVHFFGCGEGQQAAQLIRRYLPGLGSKTNHGFGMIDTISVNPMSSDRALLNTAGFPMRPLPLTFWQDMAKPLTEDEVAINEEGWRPPYWDPSNWAICAVPVVRDVDDVYLNEWIN